MTVAMPIICTKVVMPNLPLIPGFGKKDMEFLLETVRNE
jgi:hypothetical protein